MVEEFGSSCVWRVAFEVTAPFDSVVLKFVIVPFVAALELLIFHVAISKSADIWLEVSKYVMPERKLIR